MLSTTERPTIHLREGAVDVLPMPASVAAAITRLGIAQVAPWSADEWRVSDVRRVGAVRIDGHEVRIQPKVPVRNLFQLLARGRSWGTWRDDDLDLASVDDLYPAIAQAFVDHSSRALRRGVARGYVEKDELATTVRGRLLIAEQARRRHGLAVPVDVRYDDFTADIGLNRLLRSAARRLVTAGGLPRSVRGALLGIDRSLGEAELLTRGAPLPPVAWDRRIGRFRSAAALAELILTNGSFDHRVGSTTARGVLLTLAKVFEEFVEAEVVRSVTARGGWVVAQEVAPLDRDGAVEIRPDLVWRDRRGVHAVLDAKYKAEKRSGFPNADIYQMLVYCVRHRLRSGHLVYAAGNETPARYVIDEAGVTVVCHALDLEGSAESLSAQVDRLISSV